MNEKFIHFVQKVKLKFYAYLGYTLSLAKNWDII